MTAASNLKMEGKSKLLTTLKARTVKVAAVAKGSEKNEKESFVHKSDKDKQSETQKHDR